MDDIDRLEITLRQAIRIFFPLRARHFCQILKFISV